MNGIGQNIKLIRKEKGFSQEELAKILDVSRVSITRYENGTREPDLDMISKIADALETSTSKLMGLEEISSNRFDDEIQKIIYKYIPDIVDLLKLIFNEQSESKKEELTGDFFAKTSLKIANEIADIDFYELYYIFSGDIGKNINNYNNFIIAEDTNCIISDINNGKILDEINVLIRRNDFYLKHEILEEIRNEQLVDNLIKSLYDSEIMKNLATDIALFFIKEFNNITIKEVFCEYLDKLNKHGKEKVLDYIKDLLENEKYKEKNII